MATALTSLGERRGIARRQAIGDTPMDESGQAIGNTPVGESGQAI